MSGSGLYRLTYLTVPIVVTARYALRDGVHLRVSAGFAPCIRLASESFSSSEDGGTTASSFGGMRWWNASGVAGVGVEFGAQHSYSVELRGSRGLATVAGGREPLSIVTTDVGLWFGAMR